MVDKQPLTLGSGYFCSICGLSSYANIDKDALAILKAVLAPRKYIAARTKNLASEKPLLKDKDDG